MVFHWNEISGRGWENLLLGNGFSINLHRGFHYDSLLEKADELRTPIYPIARNLFNALETTNYEDVLQAIYHAYLVSMDNKEAIQSLYRNVRESLAQCVREVHVRRAALPLDSLDRCFREYRYIFTTNYDLIPYWTVMSDSPDRYRDYFWGEGGAFNPRDTDVWQGRTAIHYLHGAIHLRSDSLGRAFKGEVNLAADASSALSQDINTRPLFISEGNHRLKMGKIRSNEYLSFCYDRLCDVRGGVIVYGHQLSPNLDVHIVNALRNSRCERVAISVFVRLSDPDKDVLVAGVRKGFEGSGKELLFFSSDSHPLACGA